MSMSAHPALVLNAALREEIRIKALRRREKETLVGAPCSMADG